MGRQRLFPEALSECELMIMKLIWENKEEELGLSRIVALANEKYGRSWSPNTISTFLSRIVRKGYIVNYKRGRVYYYHIIITENQYRKMVLENQIEIWDKGSVGDYICRILEEVKLSGEEIQKINTAMKLQLLD